MRWCLLPWAVLMQGCAAAMAYVAVSGPAAQVGSSMYGSGPPPTKEERREQHIAAEVAFEDVLGLGRLMPPSYYELKSPAAASGN
jgi:hypothetical protein